jgi:hypothetical protein
VAIVRERVFADEFFYRAQVEGWGLFCAECAECAPNALYAIRRIVRGGV